MPAGTCQACHGANSHLRLLLVALGLHVSAAIKAEVTVSPNAQHIIRREVVDTVPRGTLQAEDSLVQAHAVEVRRSRPDPGWQANSTNKSSQGGSGFKWGQAGANYSGYGGGKANSSYGGKGSEHHHHNGYGEGYAKKHHWSQAMYKRFKKELWKCNRDYKGLYTGSEQGRCDILQEDDCKQDLANRFYCPKVCQVDLVQGEPKWCHALGKVVLFGDVENMDRSALKDDELSVKAFKDIVKLAVAIEAGSGIIPSDVKLTLADAGVPPAEDTTPTPDEDAASQGAEGEKVEHKGTEFLAIIKVKFRKSWKIAKVLRESRSSTLERTLVGRLNSSADIVNAKSGPLKLTHVSEAIVITPFVKPAPPIDWRKFNITKSKGPPKGYFGYRWEAPKKRQPVASTGPDAGNDTARKFVPRAPTVSTTGGPTVTKTKAAKFRERPNIHEAMTGPIAIAIYAVCIVLCGCTCCLFRLTQSKKKKEGPASTEEQPVEGGAGASLKKSDAAASSSAAAAR